MSRIVCGRSVCRNMLHSVKRGVGGGGGERKGETWVALTKIEGDFVEEKQPNTMFESL